MGRPIALVVDDDREVLGVARDGLASLPCDCLAVQGGRRALELASRTPPDLVLVDLHLRGMATSAFVAELDRIAPDAGLILLASGASLESLEPACYDDGAELLLKPLRAEEIAFRARRALAARARRGVRAGEPADGLIGESPAMRELRRQIEVVARTEATVLVTGESGTGKELVARAVHRNSRRGQGPFLAVDAGAIPAALLENELFGHQGGAYTGASGAAPGLLRAADSGTLLLDEVGELPLAAQAKLLRVLQSGELRPLGGTETFEADVRVIAATHRDLRALVAAGRFREDLFYRIHILPLRVPALRERIEDLPALVQHFLGRAAAELRRPEPAIEPSLIEKLSGHAWPGNVRELASKMRELVLTGGDVLTADDVRFDESGPILPFRAAKLELIARFERDYVRRAMTAAKGNISEAARLAGKDRKDFWLLVKKHAAATSEGDGSPADGNGMLQGEIPSLVTH